MGSVWYHVPVLSRFQFVSLIGTRVYVGHTHIRSRTEQGIPGYAHRQSYGDVYELRWLTHAYIWHGSIARASRLAGENDQVS